MSTAFQTGLVTCRCQHCNDGIEFDPAALTTVEQRTIPCPHCQMETLLYVPNKPVRSVPAIPPKSDQLPQKSSPSVLGIAFLCVVGIALIINGCMVEISKESGAIHQVYSAINYCTGWLMLAAALIIEALRSISRNQ